MVMCPIRAFSDSRPGDLAPVAVIHCGDIDSAEIVPLFAPWPTHFVLGNVDEGDDEIDEASCRNGADQPRSAFGELTIEGRRIAFLHGHDLSCLRARPSPAGAWDLVCSGHTHVRHERREKKTVVLNPGALYRATPHSLAIVDLATLDVTSVTL